MKHVYLILAHNEFEVLKSLIRFLDHVNNDIIIHYDQKVDILPELYTKYSRCFVLKNRIDGCWGDYSLVKMELELLKHSIKEGSYDLFHIISGVHYPLIPMSELHREYESVNKCIFQQMHTDDEEITARMGRYHYFNRMMMSHSFGSFGYKVGRMLWNTSKKHKKILNIQRNKGFKFYKSSQWCTLTKEAVNYILTKEREIKKRYSNTFCPDEYFVLSELMNSPLKDQILFKQNLLKQDWVSTHPKIYTLESFDELIASGCLYARKFSNENIDLLNRIDDYIQL